MALPNGTGANGRLWVLGLLVECMDTFLLMRWRYRALTCMRVAIFPRWAVCRPITLPNGMGALGPPWVRGRAGSAEPEMLEHWRLRAPSCMRAAISPWRAECPPTTLPKLFSSGRNFEVVQCVTPMAASA